MHVIILKTFNPMWVRLNFKDYKKKTLNFKAHFFAIQYIYATSCGPCPSFLTPFINARREKIIPPLILSSCHKMLDPLAVPIKFRTLYIALGFTCYMH